MAFASCSGLLLSFLIILLALEYSTADGYQGKIGTKRETGNEMSLLDSFDGAIAAAYANGRNFIRGRKMLQGLDEKTLSISGKSKPSDLEKSFQERLTERDHVDFQDKVETLKQEGNHKSEGPGVPREAAPTSSDKKNGVKHDDYGAMNNDERKAFLDAADEVANLMRKDYKGGDRPRRKPPINNHQPKD